MYKNLTLWLTLVAMTILCLSPSAQEARDHYDQLPDLGSNAANFLSDRQAALLGQAFIRQSRYQMPYVYDPELNEYINRLGNKLLRVSEDADKKYHFYLIDNDVINAFAVPGGHIALHTAILTKSESESELASVIAHEIAHVTQHHIARKLENSQYDSILALGALLAAAAAGGGDAAQAAFGVANASIVDRQLSYSRSFETEADSLGIRLLSRAGFAPEAMPRFFKRLLDESRINASHAPEFLRSHPLTINRITASSERVRAYPKSTPPDQSEFLLMQAKTIAGYSEDKARARDYFIDRINRGDDSLYSRYGLAMALSANGEYKRARDEIDKLIVKHPKNISLRLLQADNELNAQNIDHGLELLSELHSEQIELGNRMIDVYYANALVLTRNHDKAIPLLRSAIKNDPTEPYFHILLSRAYGETNQTMQSFEERGEYHYLRGNHTFAIQQIQRARSLAKTEYDKARLGAKVISIEEELFKLQKL